MTDMIWLGGVATTIFLVMLSFFTPRWWPLAYLGALVMGFGTGALLWDWPAPLRATWWFAGTIYAVTLPFWRISEGRRNTFYGDK